jgi:hypothetical protein
VAVGDVTGDGDLELVVADGNGNVACFDVEGKELWETQVSGFVSQHASLGDVNGDGQVDVVVGTSLGAVYALSGKDGSVLPNFPVKTGSQIQAPTTVAHLSSGEAVALGALLGDKPKSAQVLFPSFDGHLYIIDGLTGCTNKYDLGEDSYSRVLVDDVIGNGRMDLVVANMNGNVFCFSTGAPYNRLGVSASASDGSVFSLRDNYMGIRFTPYSKQRAVVSGPLATVEFEIVDRRSGVEQAGAQYEVRIYQTVRSTLWKGTYSQPGKYQVELDMLHRPESLKLTVELTNEFRQVFTDAQVLDFNVHYYKLLKWILVLPFLLMAAVLLNLAPSTRADSSQKVSLS